MLSRLIVVAIALSAVLLPAGRAAAQSAPPPAKPAGPATVAETILGTLTGYDPARKNTDFTIVMNLDANHVAFIGARGKEQFVVLDGKPSSPYEWIIPESLTFSADGAHLAWLIQTANETQVVLDGQAGKGFFNVMHNHVFFSPDGKHTAISVQYKDGGGAVVVDGEPGPRFDAIGVPVFSPDSRRVAHVAKNGKQECVFVDGKKQKYYDAVGRLAFSPDSKYLAYEAIEHSRAMLVMVDRGEGKTYDSIRLGPVFTPDGARLIAVVAQSGRLIVIINGRESPAYEAMLAGDFSISGNGKRLGYAVKEGDHHLAVIDGVAQPPFHHLAADSLCFSPDSKRFAYAAGTGARGPEYIVVDGVKQKDCDGILVGTPFFSPDSKRVAYGAARGFERDRKWQLVVDGVEGKLYDVVEPPAVPIFSPDSQRVAYRAAIDNKPLAVVDNVEAGPFEKVGPISFSPDSRHYAYLRVRNSATWAVVDNVEVAGPYNSYSPQTRVYFDDATTAHFIATRKEDFVYVKLKMGP